MGDVQKLRKDLDRVNLEYSQLEAQIKERQSAGIPPSEDDYQKLLKLYNQRQTLEKQIDTADEREEQKPSEKKLLSLALRSNCVGAALGSNLHHRHRNESQRGSVED